MEKKPHAFRNYVTDWVESKEFRKQEEQYPEPSEPMQIGLPGGIKINVNKDLFEATKKFEQGGTLVQNTKQLFYRNLF